MAKNGAAWRKRCISLPYTDKCYPNVKSKSQLMTRPKTMKKTMRKTKAIRFGNLGKDLRPIRNQDMASGMNVTIFINMGIALCDHHAGICD